MTLAEAQEIVRLAQVDFDKANSDLKDINDAITNKVNEANEWKRQVTANAAAGNQAGMIANGANYDQALETLKQLQAQKVQILANIDTANKALVRARMQLEPLEKAQFEADLAKNDPAAYAAYKLANGQKSTKYLIGGTIALIIVFIGVVILRKAFQ